MASKPYTVQRIRNYQAQAVDDLIAHEEPLEIGIRTPASEQIITVTMRTPGDDASLAAGLLFTEGVVQRAGDIVAIEQTADNQIWLTLAHDNGEKLARFKREFISNSSCGVCGKMSVAALALQVNTPWAAFAPMDLKDLLALPDQLRAAQILFDETGSVHAAGLFDRAGKLLVIAEDVGRHNAVDKVIGRALLEQMDISQMVLVVSARAGFELVQKAIVARIPVMLAVGGPTSLAVDLAREYGLSLAAFARGERVNVYSGAERLMI